MTHHGIQEWLNIFNSSYIFTSNIISQHAQEISPCDLKKAKREMRPHLKKYESILAQAKLNGDDYLIKMVEEAGEKIESYLKQLENCELRIATYLDEVEAEPSVQQESKQEEVKPMVTQETTKETKPSKTKTIVREVGKFVWTFCVVFAALAVFNAIISRD